VIRIQRDIELYTKSQEKSNPLKIFVFALSLNKGKIMSHHNYLLVLISLIQLLPASHAEITFDSSLGSAIELTGPNYTIAADKGKMMGNNLFHSFGTFNINQGESAIFTGPNQVANIIGRVTGGSLSRIDGTLKSTIPNADFYLLNPNGFMLGKNARVNINGSLYLSSANYLRFADGWQFHANASPFPLLTVAPPAAFGFMDSTPGDLTIKGEIKVAEGKKIAVIGGNIQISDGDHSHLLAPRGHINIVSAASRGEIMRSDVTNHTLTEFGDISIEKNGLLNVNMDGAKSGSVVILGGQFFMSESHIQTLSDMGTGNIEITSTEQLQITDSSLIRMGNGQGNAGKIILRAQNIKLSNGGAIFSESSGKGQGGSIILHAQNIELSDGEAIISKSLGEGQGGSIEVRATDSVSLEISALHAITVGKGDAGNIDIETNDLKLANDAQINASSKGAGKSGEITIKANNAIDISGYFSDDNNIYPSGIASSAFANGQGGTIHISAHSLKLDDWATIQTLTKGEGHAGDIFININKLQITNGADIDASNEGSGSGKGGNIFIDATASVLISGRSADEKTIGYAQPIIYKNYLGGIYSVAENRGMGGDIILTTPFLDMRDGGAISVGSTSLGNAGNLKLHISRALTMDNAGIISRATQASGGQIDLQIRDHLFMTHSKITTEVEGDETHDNAGDITINNPSLFTLNSGEILANANVGKGGNINIIAENFIPSSDSILNASSQLGIDGEIQITAGEENFSSSLVALTKTLADASRLLVSCVGSERDESHFVVTDYLSDTDREDMLKNPQPSSFKEKLEKSEIFAFYQSLQKQLAITSTKESRSKILEQLAALYEHEHRYPEALQLNKQALKALKLLNAPYWRYKWQWQRGRLFKALGEYKNAIIAYQTAIKKLVPIRQHLTKIYRERYPNGERSEFREVLKPIFTELVALLLELSEPLQTAAKNKLLETALQTMNQLKTAELQDYFQDDCTKPTINLEQVDPRHTTIIYPIFLPNRVELLVSLPQAQRFHQIVPATPNQLTRTINTLATQLNCQTKDCRENHSYRASAKKLYDWLLRPLEPELSNDIHTLVFVPDGPLYSIPMAVLHDGYQFLIEKYALAVTPSLTITEPTTKPFSPKILYSALTASNHPNFAPIQQYVIPMQKELEKTFGPITTLKGRNFIRPNLSQALRIPHTITHVFSHAQFSPQVSNTFIVTYNEKLSMNQLEQLISPKQHSEVPLELLTLSACETAKGDERAALGLAGIAYKAGARSAVATLWSVRDDVVYHLFKKFYQELAEKQPKAQAMRQAQLMLLKQYPSWQHPHYWAAFLLIGHWL